MTLIFRLQHMTSIMTFHFTNMTTELKAGKQISYNYQQDSENKSLRNENGRLTANGELLGQEADKYYRNMGL